MQYKWLFLDYDIRNYLILLVTLASTLILLQYEEGGLIANKKVNKRVDSSIVGTR